MIELEEKPFGQVLHYLISPNKKREALRFGNEYSATGTVAEVTDSSEANIWTWAGHDNGQNMAIAIFRNPLRNAVIYMRNPLGGGFSDYIFMNQIPTYLFLVPAHTQLKIQPSAAEGVGQVLQHKEILFPGHDDLGEYYLWLDSDGLNNGIAFTCDTNLGATGCVNVFRYDGRKGNLEYNIPFSLFTWTGAVFIYVLSSIARGYYRLEVSNQTANDGRWIFDFLTYNNNDDFWGHRTMPEYIENYQIFKDIRIHSVGVEILNVNPPLYKNGQVVGVQLPRTENFLTYAQGNVTNIFFQVSEARDAGVLMFANGFQSYLKPTQLSDFQMRHSLSHPGNSQNTHWAGTFPLLDDSSWMLIAIYSFNACPSLNSGTTTNIHVGFEFETTTQLACPRFSQVPAKEWRKAIKVLQSIPQYWSQGLTFKHILKYLNEMPEDLSTIINIDE